MTTLVIPGSEDPTGQRSVLAGHLPDGTVRTERSLHVAAARDGAAAEQVLDVADDRVIEIELENGGFLWTRADVLARDIALATGSDVSRGAEAGSGAGGVRVPLELPFGGRRSRGVGAWVIKGLKVLGVDIAGSITDFVTTKVEGRLEPGPGLYRCGTASPTALLPVGTLDVTKPVLVFLHGTFSSVEGSFGNLWNDGEHGIGRLLDHYDGQVLAFQHRTATESPIRNALDLLGALDASVGGDTPPPWRLHLVSHSRGGLVGELLCRGTALGREPFDADDLALFDAAPYAADRAALAELGARLAALPPRIERFVRVACPARGTTLADGRLDRYLSRFVNVLQHTPGLGGPLFDAVSTLTLGVVHKRTEPQELPGIEAMMPISPTVRMLNRPDVTVAADLRVIGGDISAGGWNRLKVLLADLYYREDHDLVVNTPAMLGGAARVSPVLHWIDQGSRVNHFRYFGNAATAERLFDGLFQAEPPLFRRPEDIDPESGKDYRIRAGEPLPIAIVLPGIMGSQLCVGGRRIWIDLIGLARGGLAELDVDAADVVPDGPIPNAYGGLLRALATSHDVRPFAYDWRRSLGESAALLEAVLETALADAERNGQPIRLVAHSMGGLVVRALLARPIGRALWRRACAHEGSRFLMLGTPSAGAHAMGAMLLGRDGLMQKLAMLDLCAGQAELLRIVARFDGVLELLPADGSADLFDAATWRRLHAADLGTERGLFGGDGIAGSESSEVAWSVPEAARLAAAKALRGKLAEVSFDPERTLYVAGVAGATASDVGIDESAPPGRRVRVSATADGDGRVTWRSGIPRELAPENVYYLDAAHGDLTATPSAFPAILELLERGTTERLPRRPPAGRDVETETDPFPLPPVRTDRFPDRADLLAAALGGTIRRSAGAAPRVRVRTRVVHGDLGRSAHPVLVGHHEGDTIASAEDYLDRQLEGRLRDRHRLGLYPGELGSSLVMLDPRDGRAHDAHPGAIVVGLGEYGELSPGRLIDTLVRAMTDYALNVLDEARHRAARAGAAPSDMVGAPMSALLVGSGGELGVADSLQSILRAVERTNRRLRELGRRGVGQGDAAGPGADDAPIVQIDRLDIVECWEDRAVLAARALRAFGDGPEFADGFDIERHLHEARDGRRRVATDDVAGGWQRMRIRADERGEIEFESFATRGRVQSSLQPTQRRLVDRYLQRAVASTRHDATLGRTLFELLVPDALKQYAPDRQRLVLVVDDTTARYPWELLQDAADAEGLPMSVRAGLIRQLPTGGAPPTAALAPVHSALVIGDPGPADGSAYALLPGAREEARRVSRQLEGAGCETTLRVGDDVGALEVIDTLYARPYGVLHIAAHGVHEQAVDANGDPRVAHPAAPGATSEGGTISGVVLRDGLYLTPAEISRRHVPQLVFLNCCHLGRIDGGGSAAPVAYPRLAASLATQFIRLGARAVVAAGWAVDDAAASLFAEVFYERMLGGSSFGEAVYQARRRVHDDPRHRVSNTWGAYQCYGDPDFTLRGGRADDEGRREIRPVAAAELRQEVDAMARRVVYADEPERRRVREQLERLVHDAPVHWMRSGALCASLAALWGELGEFGEASECYDRARRSESADGSVASMQQLANLRARFAVQRLDEAGAEGLETCRAELGEAMRMIDALLEIGETQERWALKGGIHKRRAMIEPDAARRTHLEQMEAAYRCSLAIARENGSSNVFYPLQNLVAARVAQRWTTDRDGAVEAADDERDVAARDETIERGIAELSAELADQLIGAAAGESDFWTLCRLPDLRLLRALADGVLDAAEESGILDAYDAARRRGGTRRELRTIVENIDFFRVQLARAQDAAPCERPDGGAGVAALQAALDRLRTGVDALGG